MRGHISKLIWIDSSVNTHGDRTKVLVPSHPFSAAGNERMGLTLVSFAMRRNWYNVNPTNNTAYIYVGNTYYEFTITPGVYSTFASLATALQNALNETIIASVAQITSAAVAYSATTRLFTITFTMAAGHNATVVQIRTFAIKGGALPAGVGLQGGFSDVHEILGAKPLRDATDDFNSMTQQASNVCRSKFPASLNTLDAIYVHLTTLETGNFMSTGHEVHIADSLRLVESSLFARIPFDDSSFTEVHEVIQFEDSGGDMFQSMLTRKSLENLEIRVTDARGRSLANMDPTQADEGLMAFKMCLRWDLFISPSPPEPSHGTRIKFEHPPKM
jgi:hypothetical protein